MAAEPRSNKEIVQSFFDNLWINPPVSKSLATEDVTWVTTRSMPIPGATAVAVDGLAGIEHIGWDAVEHVAHSALKLDTGYLPETMEFPVREFLDVEDDRVIFRFTLKCRTKAGRDYVNDYLMFTELRGGKVARFQEYWDSKQAYDVLLAPVTG